MIKEAMTEKVIGIFSGKNYLKQFNVRLSKNYGGKLFEVSSLLKTNKNSLTR
jgi:hypothetical protein